MLSTFGLNSILLVAALFLGYPSRSKKANLNIAKFFGILNIVVIIDHAVKVAVSFVRDLSHPGFLPGKVRQGEEGPASVQIQPAMEPGTVLYLWYRTTIIVVHSVPDPNHAYNRHSLFPTFKLIYYDMKIFLGDQRQSIGVWRGKRMTTATQ